ncbi:MAG: PhoPQ-activated pathogenicity-related family protein [Pirellulaceae bacterium]|nr:PhoPQ-activated pathogenicity-related family protein [Pirellulaceae bacterium]
MPTALWRRGMSVLTWFLLGGWGGVMGPDARCQETALDRYVAQPDASYRWDIVKTIRQNGLTTFVIDLKSQTWRSPNEVDRTLWQHWLVVAKPDGATANTALLFIAGGKNGGDPPNEANERVTKLALGSRSVVATLLMVPNQPLIFHNDGQPRVEDDLIAYTWTQFFKTGDATWPARNPMVKSAVRAMDTITALMASEAGGQMKVDKFVVAGGSKRGWTTWITGAVDSRVVAIAPIVIDVVNVQESMRHHYSAYGFWAPAVGDYTRHRIFEWLGTPEMEALQQLVDPFSYRARLQMPKFILNAAGDQFFLPDSSQFYFDDLLGEKYLRYVPNGDHSLDGTDATESLLAFYLTVLHNLPRPQLTWTFEPDGAIRAVSQTPVAQAMLWQATNPAARDFRVETLGKEYRGSALADQGGGVFLGRVTPPDKGWTAYFIELTYDIGQRLPPLKLTTAVRVTPDTLPFADKDPLAE